MSKPYVCDACRDEPERCERCRARRALDRRERRARYRKAGLCSECGLKAKRGHSRCAEHIAANNARSGASHARAAAR